MLPVVLLIGALVWQLALAGHAAWLCAQAARVAARADSVGSPVGPAARSALPGSLRRDLEVVRLREGGVRVSVAIPLLIGQASAPIRVSATAALGRAR